MRRLDPYDVIVQFLEVRRSREQPHSLAGWYTSDEPLSPRAIRLPFASASTALPSGRWEQLCRWTRGVAERSFKVFELELGVVAGKPGRDEVRGARAGQTRAVAQLGAEVVYLEGREPLVYFQPRPLKPKLADVAKAMQASVNDVRAWRREALRTVAENMGAR